MNHRLRIDRAGLGWLLSWVVLLACTAWSTAAWANATLASRDVPIQLPPGAAAAGVDGSSGAVVAIGDETVFVLPHEDASWTASPQTRFTTTPAAVLGTSAGVLHVGGTDPQGQPLPDASLVSSADGQVVIVDLPPLPAPTAAGSAARVGEFAYVTDGSTLWSRPIQDSQAAWSEQALPAEFSDGVVLAEQMDDLFVFGMVSDGATQTMAGYRGKRADDSWVWRTIAAPPTLPDFPRSPRSVSFGLAHILLLGLERGETQMYHAITDRWLTLPDDAFPVSADATILPRGDEAWLLGPEGTLAFRPAQLPTNYSWVDNLVVVFYLLGMIGIGWYFTKRENSSNDFFRGGQRIPWWAAGMSLFATGASAISLAGMPGIGFGTDWTYFTISIASACCLPIGIFIMAPLVRRLQIKTANEYLERRFGLTSRLFASTIFMFTQIAARIASVMLLSAIALEAITDMDIVTAIIVMGVVTTIYTYLGGLEAVIWTDTVQGFVMVATVVGCLLLALWKLDQPPAESWALLQDYDKLHMFDFSASLIGPTTFIFFVHTLFLTFGGISDQNFVQRVQSTPSLTQTKLAVATQMAVAVPINVLLFSLGTALWLFYRDRPESLSPTIVNNDGVFPFFAAQQLPIGVSGIVVAALLAATMSTVSSSICAVSDLGTNDFYRRFKSNATDHQCLVLGRILTAVVGVSGTAAAIVLASIDDVKSVWDLAIMVTGLISSSVLGLFMLGLLTRRTHEVGALVGAAAGMGTIVYLKMYSPITFWLYIVIGPLVTIGVGVLASLVLPGTPRETRGLTLYSLRYADAVAAPRD